MVKTRSITVTKIFDMCHITILLILLTLSLTIAAQDDDITTWAVEERCIPAPTAVPDDWSYPGTILLSGYAGIHGVRMDWETPHVVAFFRSDSQFDEPLIGGQLSPDGRWYAVPVGELYREISYNYYIFVNGWRVYSTSDDQQVLEFDMQDYDDIYRYFAAAGTYLPIEWVDNESFVIGGILFNPFDNTAETASFDTYTWGRRPLISPNLEVAYGDISEDDAYQFGLYRIDDPLATFTYLGAINDVSWKHDSSGLMANMTIEEQNWKGLAYFDNQGVLLDYVYSIEDDSYHFPLGSSERNDLQWSQDNRYFAFTFQARSPHLYIADFENQIIIDTCLSPISLPVWSPDSNMLAYVANARENLKVVVVDLDRWQAFDVARHSGLSSRMPNTGYVVGWRAEDN